MTLLTRITACVRLNTLSLASTAETCAFTVVIDKDGKLIRTFKGDLPNEELEKIINPLIG